MQTTHTITSDCRDNPGCATPSEFVAVEVGAIIEPTDSRYAGRIIMGEALTTPTFTPRTPFATWLAIFPDDGGTPYCTWGHYFQTKDEAAQDFAERERRGY